MSTPPRFYSSTALPTNLTTSITNADTTIQVGSTDGFPASTPFTLALDYGSINEELVDVTAVAGLSLTVTRAVDFTSASSHNAGAIVRHVSSGRDFREAKAHELADTNVHGFTPADGEFVGTTKTQTLTNKTLTAPTINSGTMSGTFAGAHTYAGAITFNSNIGVGGSISGASLSIPGTSVLTGGGTLSGTFSGSPIFTGAASHTDSITVTRALATNRTFVSQVTGDSNARLAILADGRMEWSPGSGASDTYLRRAAANLLATEATILAQKAVATDNIHLIGVTGEANARLAINGNGLLNWGPGGGAGADTNLYRQGASVLATDDLFRIVRPSSSDDAISVRALGDTADRFRINDSGIMSWGPGGASSPDTNLYRSTANVLRTDDAFESASSITAAGKVISDNLRAGSALAPSAGPSGGTSFVNVTFSNPMPAVPAVNATPNSTVDPNPSGVEIRWVCDNVTTNGFTIRCYRNSNSATNFSWIAMVQ